MTTHALALQNYGRKINKEKGSLDGRTLKGKCKKTDITELIQTRANYGQIFVMDSYFKDHYRKMVVSGFNNRSRLKLEPK